METAEEYNKKYCPKISGKKKVKIAPRARNAGDIFWDNMSEAERKEFCESYLTFLEYYSARKDDKRR